MAHVLRGDLASPSLKRQTATPKPRIDALFSEAISPRPH